MESNSSRRLDYRAEVPLRREREFQSAVYRIAWNLAVPQRDQLADFLVQETVGTVAGGVRWQPERLAVERRENALGRT